MNAILGKITKVKELRSKGDGAGRLRPVELSFKPVCIVPGHSQPPEWLKDQVLKVRRRVADLREVGGVGDSIVLSPAESEAWLYPLVVEPAVAHGQLPPTLRLKLRWWKDEKPGEFTVCAPGRRKTGNFTRRGKVFTASLATRDFLEARPSLPTELKVSFGKVEVGCAVLPDDRPSYLRHCTPSGERHRVESDWYAIHVCPSQGGGVISMLEEKGRGVDHFRADQHMIGPVHEHAGHLDRAQIGPSQNMLEVAMTCATARREGGATRLCLEGMVDEGGNVRTRVAYTVFDSLPLMLLERTIMFAKSEKKDEKEEQKKATELVDEMLKVELSFRAAYRFEKGDTYGSRILSVEEDRFAALRPVQTHDWLRNGWRLTDGWAIMEHPGRQECTMYMFDGQNAPVMGMWLGEGVVTLEPRWLPVPLANKRGTGFSLALSAGEICGAGVAGAWVACRRPLTSGGVKCALVGRFREPVKDETATMRLGDESARVPFEKMLLPGIGAVYAASASFPDAGRKSKFTASAGGIPARRLK